MATIRDITTMCKAGNIQEAYELAKNDLESTPNDIWRQKALGWALYYMIKNATEAGNYHKLLTHLDELCSLNQLSINDDSILFNNLQFKIADFIRNHINSSDIGALDKLSNIFDRLRNLSFNTSDGHSRLLQSIIKLEAWSEMANFLEWWNLDTLSQEDYIPYVNEKGKKLMSLAERAYIAYAKALLKSNDINRIEAFLPKLDMIVTQHEEMQYPGYFYGKLLLAIGGNTDDALKTLIPFARKKATEFWVWQLLSEVFSHDEEKQLACLLRAVHCKTQETFLGKVRIKLAALYIKMGLLDHAHHQIDIITHNYAEQRRHLPYEVGDWLHQDWLNTTTPNHNSPIDYKSITDEILCEGTDECIAVVTYVDPNSHKSSLIYGKKLSMTQKLPIKTTVGSVLKLNYVANKDGKIKIIAANKTILPANLNYAKNTHGIIEKRDDNAFAFLKAGSLSCFISPTLVKFNHLNNQDTVNSLIVYDYNKKKESWNWVCVSIDKRPPLK